MIDLDLIDILKKQSRHVDMHHILDEYITRFLCNSNVLGGPSMMIYCGHLALLLIKSKHVPREITLEYIISLE